LAEIARRVDARMLDLLDRQIQYWGDADGELTEPLSALRDLVVAGGKRLRPAFCHWAFVGAGGEPDDPLVIDAGAAIELLHTFALIHDDIMDGSSTRRGADTIHVTFEQHHALSAWRGEARRFGEGVAILAGDLAFVYADQLLLGAPVDAVRVFNDLRVEVNIGQYLDLVGTAKGNVDHDAAARISRYKSGKYTVERPLHLGAALAGRLGQLEGALSQFGLPLGEAFQMRDDLLGVFGDPSATGKPVGEDLREGKPTVLFATAVQLADANAAKVLERYGASDIDDDEISVLQEVLVGTGAVESVERAIDALVGEAFDALGHATLTVEARTALAELAEFVAGRDR
jgi:geranylgeranyl diphosphate synthase type I